MKLFNNKNLKHLILPMFILTIVMCIAFTIQTFNQYKKVSIIVNQKIANIIGTITEKHQEIDTKEIVKILNSSNIKESKTGQAELLKYGIDIKEVNSIIQVENQMKSNLIANILLIVLFSFLWLIIILFYLKRRDKKIKQITKYINEIKETELGKVMDKIFNIKESGKGKGGISFLTRDEITRIDLTRNAFIMALTKHINGEIWR